MPAGSTLITVLGFGVLGVSLRFFIDQIFSNSNFSFPIHTLAINILGSLIAGIIFAISIQKNGSPTAFSLAIITGFCGGFTTFSAFALQSYQMIEKGQWAIVVGYATLSPVLCIGAVICGVQLTKTLV